MHDQPAPLTPPSTSAPAPLEEGYERGPLPRRPRVLFMGTPEFAVPALSALLEWGAEVVGVVSQPDRPKGRGKQVQRTPVAARADEAGLPVFQWARLSNESYAALSALAPDLAVVIAYGKLLPRRYLALPRWGCVNLHASLLPSYRGAAPIQWSVIKGERAAGVSVMRLDEGMDTGGVALTRALEVGARETAGALHDRLSLLAAEALREALGAWVDAPLTFTPQDHARASHAPMLAKEDGLLRWERPALELARLARGVHPWPGAYTELPEGALKVHACEEMSEEELLRAHPSAAPLPPGAVVEAAGAGPLVRCGEGALRLTSVQRPSRGAVSGADFCRGYPLCVGAPLSAPAPLSAGASPTAPSDR